MKKYTIRWKEGAPTFSDAGVLELEKTLFAHRDTLTESYICQMSVLTMIRTLVAEKALVFDEIVLIAEVDGLEYEISMNCDDGRLEWYPEFLNVQLDYFSRVRRAVRERDSGRFGLHPPC